MIMLKTKPKHIVIFIPNLGGGGAQRVMLNLALDFHKRGHRVNFVLVHKEGSYLKNVPKGINVLSFTTLTKRRYKMPQMLFLLARYLRREKPDILLSAMNPCNLIAIIARMLSGSETKIAVSEHNVFLPEESSVNFIIRRTLPYLIKLLYPKADFVIATTKGMADDLSEATGLPKEIIDVIYNPVVRPEIFEKSKEKVSHPFFKDKSDGVLINVGSLNKQKDHSNLIKAFSILRRSKAVRLIILGEGENRENLEKMIQDLNLKKFVSMPGFVDNPYAYMVQSDVFVLSSRWEGLPTVLIEAMACGIPVVSTNCPTGPAEILENGKYGKLVPVDDPVALAEALKETLDNPPDPQKLRERANYFSVKASADKYLKIIGF